MTHIHSGRWCNFQHQILHLCDSFVPPLPSLLAGRGKYTGWLSVSTEFLGVMVSGGGCHGYLHALLDTHISLGTTRFRRHLPQAHLLAMSLNNSYIFASTLILTICNLHVKSCLGHALRFGQLTRMAWTFDVFETH